MNEQEGNIEAVRRMEEQKRKEAEQGPFGTQAPPVEQPPPGPGKNGEK